MQRPERNQKFFSFTPAPATQIYTLSLHDALPISLILPLGSSVSSSANVLILPPEKCASRSEEHTSELQSRFDLVCRLLLEKKNLNVHSLPARQATHASSPVVRLTRCPLI